MWLPTREARDHALKLVGGQVAHERSPRPALGALDVGEPQPRPELGEPARPVARFAAKPCVEVAHRGVWSSPNPVTWWAIVPRPDGGPRALIDQSPWPRSYDARPTDQPAGNASRSRRQALRSRRPSRPRVGHRHAGTRPRTDDPRSRIWALGILR